MPFKTVADKLLRIDPVEFLRQLQTAVGSFHTPPMTAQQLALSTAFNQFFGNGHFSPQQRTEQMLFAAGARDAQQAIFSDYLDNTGPTNWVHFTNIGQWGPNFLDRSAISEFIQVANGPDTAAYYQTFKEAKVYR